MELCGSHISISPAMLRSSNIALLSGVTVFDHELVNEVHDWQRHLVALRKVSLLFLSLVAITTNC